MATNPLLADPRANPFRRPPVVAPDPLMQPAARRQPIPGNRFGTGGTYNNTRTLVGDAGFAVGRTAQAARPNARAMSRAQIAQAAGIEDWKGPKDPRAGLLDQAFHGQNYAGANASDPEAARYRANMERYFTEGPGAAMLAGGGGPGAPVGAGGGGGGAPRDFAGELQGFISDVLGGNQGPYTPEAIANLKAGAFDEFAGGLTAANRGAVNRARRSGNLYSASTGSALRENEQAARASLGSQMRGVDTTAIQENFGARMNALTSGLQKLQSDRDLAMGQAKDATDRERIRSEYDQAIETTQMQISSQEKLAREGADRAGAAAGRGRAWDLEDQLRQREWQLADRDYEENWRLFDAGLSAGGDEF